MNLGSGKRCSKGSSSGWCPKSLTGHPQMGQDRSCLLCKSLLKAGKKGVP